MTSSDSARIGENRNQGDGEFFSVKTVKMMGFKALLGWHYLMLFSPLFIGEIDEIPYAFLFERQLALYVALAVSFGLLVLLGRRRVRANKLVTPPSLIVFTGVFSTAATMFSIAVIGTTPAWQYVATVLLGCSEAMFMFLWLHYYRMAAGRSLHRSFAFDMMCGGIIGFFICSLTPPLGLVVAACLPPLSMISLIVNWRTVETVEAKAEIEAPEADRRESSSLSSMMEKGKRGSVFRHVLKTLLPTMVYAFVFGLVQGGYLVSDIALLMAGSPLVLLGVVLAGGVIFLIPERLETNADIDSMHRFSLMFFVLGVVGLLLFEVGDAVVIIAEIAILAGFNLFDFGGLILGMGFARRLRPESRMPIDGARPLVYISLALGLAAGNIAVSLGGGALDGMALLSILGISMAMLVATVLTPFREKDAFSSPDSCLWSAARKDASGAIVLPEGVEFAGLPPCANRAEGPCPSCPVASGGAVEAAKAEGASEERGSAGEAAPSSAAGDAEPSSASAAPSSSRRGGKEAASSRQPAEQKRVDSPWRRTCAEIAELYRLSPRETEIFFLIAKGRNAEFVQQKLVISTHTAKTHIANIYHKLGVHSSQEMLSLIEAFREEDIKSRQLDGE